MLPGNKQIKSLIFVVLALMLVGCNGFRPAADAERTVEIGLLVRKQFTTDIGKDRYGRHLDVLLPGGRIVGFNVSTDEVDFIKYVFRHTPGTVRELEELKRIRKHYICAETAQNCSYKGRNGLRMVTVWARFRVTPQQARELVSAWDRMAENPPEFRLWGKNCASRAAEAFVEAGILPWGLPMLDTPEALLHRVLSFYPDAELSKGYFGFDGDGKPYMIPLAGVDGQSEIAGNAGQGL